MRPFRSGLVLALLLVLVSCATTGAPGEGDRDLPTSGVGPFRRFADAEVLGIAPFVLEEREARYRDPSAILGDDGAVVLFAVATTAPGRDVLVRTRATDGRTFFGAAGDFGRRPVVVLEPSEAWEGGGLAGPSIVRRGAEWLLYYGASGGIGLARSSDGIVFRKERGPVLFAGDGWETTPPRAPGAYLLPDGRVRLLYASGVAIGEASSDDGVTFRRAGAPILGPTEDAVRVSDPCPSPRVTPAGRVQLRVLYTHEDAAGGSSIRFAARYGDAGALTVQPIAVYAVGQRERAPTFLDDGAGRTLLYVEQERRLETGAVRLYPGIAGAVAPANVTLAPPAPFPDAP